MSTRKEKSRGAKRTEQVVWNKACVHGAESIELSQ